MRGICSHSTIPIINTLPSSLPSLTTLHHPFPTAWLSFLTQRIRSIHAWPPSLPRTHLQTHAPIFVKLIPPCLHGRAWPHGAAITPSQPCNIHVNTHFFHIYLHENPAPHHLSMPKFRSPHVHPASASSSTNVGFNSSTQLACYGSFAAATSRMLSANELSLNGQIPTDKALHAPTKAAAASSPPTPGRCS